ncbi:MAG: hypothetical protein Q9195_002925 [Heterodermia aff. obscurata]
MDVADATDASSLDVLVPAESALDIERFLGSSGYENSRPSDPPLLSTIPQRDVLYFDESIPIYITLRTNHFDKSRLITYIDRLAIALEIIAFTPRSRSDDGRHASPHLASSPSHEIIWSGTIDTSQKPTVAQSFQAIPAITTKVRYSRVNAVTGKPTIVASMDIETGTFFDHDVCIESVQMKLSEGSSEDLCKGIPSMLPMICRPKDNPTFLFRLVASGPLSDVSGPNSNSRTLDISIEATVLTNESCRPCIKMRWRAGVDFSTTLNPTYHIPTQSLQRSNRPTNIALSHAISSEIVTPGSGQALHSQDGHRRERPVSVSDLGLSVTFTGPDDIFVGEPFCWDIFVVNRSSKPRKLAIAVVPKFKNGDVGKHLCKSFVPSTGGRKGATIAEAIIDEKLLYAMRGSAIKEVVQIVSLSNEVRIGTLAPGSCFNGELKFLPLAKGMLQIEAVRIVDAATNHSVEVRDLPEIIASERSVKDQKYRFQEARE